MQINKQTSAHSYLTPKTHTNTKWTEVSHQKHKLPEENRLFWIRYNTKSLFKKNNNWEIRAHQNENVCSAKRTNLFGTGDNCPAPDRCLRRLQHTLSPEGHRLPGGQESCPQDRLHTQSLTPTWGRGWELELRSWRRGFGRWVEPAMRWDFGGPRDGVNVGCVWDGSLSLGPEDRNYCTAWFHFYGIPEREHETDKTGSELSAYSGEAMTTMESKGIWGVDCRISSLWW